MKSFANLKLATFLILVSISPSLFAQESAVEFPVSFADFAMDPQSGAVCGIDADNNEAYIFDAKFFDGMDSEASDPVKVGSTPVCVTFKVFGKQRYFVVSCTEDSHLYVIDAVKKTLVKKISVQQSGVSWVTNSLNPEDPFVYYCFGGGHDSMTGAISLRNMSDCGKAFDDSMDAMISADGKIAYRRGPWSPSGFESLQMTNGFDADAPKFTRLFYEHDSTAQYLPDPFGEITAAGNKFYSKDLKRSVASTGGTPLCFLKDKPFVICGPTDSFARRSRSSRSGRSGRGSADKSQLYCISVNTMKPVGSKVPISLSRVERQLPRGSLSSADFKRVQTKRRFLPDEERDRLLVLNGKIATVIDLADFELPAEVPMRLTQRAYTMTVGQPQIIELATTNPAVKMEIDDLPDQAKLENNAIHWSPTGDQVGTIKMNVGLRHGEIERLQRVEFLVSYPFISLPHKYTDIAISPDGQQAVVWEKSNRSNGMHMPHSETIEPTNRLAILDLGSMKVSQQKRMPYQIAAAFVDKHFVYVSSAEAMYCEIFDKKTLKKIKTLYSNNSISKIDSNDQTLTLGNKSYSLPDLKVTTALTSENVQVELLKQIEQLHFVRIDRSSSAMAAVDNNRYREEMLRNQRSRRNSRNVRLSSEQRLTSKAANVAAWQESKTQQVPNATHTMERILEVGLDVTSRVTNARVKRVSLAKVKSPIPMGGRNSMNPNATTPMAVCNDRVLVLAEDLVYFWNAAELGDLDLPTELKIENAKPIVISEPASSKHVLKISGGQGPYELALLSGGGMLQVDGNEISVDGKRYLDNGKAALKEALQRKFFNNPVALKDEVAEYRTRVAAVVGKLLGEENKNKLPFTSKVKLRVVDSESQSTEVSIPIIVALDASTLDSAYKELEAERAKFEAEREARKVEMEKRRAESRRRDRSTGSGDEVQQLRERVETLEAQVDLLTRQLSELLRQQRGGERRQRKGYSKAEDKK